MSEREYCPAISESLIRNAISSLQLTETVKYTNSTKTVASCLLRNRSGLIVSEGAGKGRHCILGALGESVEHYLMQQHKTTNCMATPTSEIRAQPALALDGILSNLPINPNQIDCIHMKDMQTGILVKIPIVLLQPDAGFEHKIKDDHELSFLTRYATNSGSAFGCSEGEAILHGLNEAIERHILSNMLMTLCGQHESLAMNTLEEGALEDVFSDFPQFIPRAKEMRVLLYKSIFGTFFSVALPKRPQGRHPICPIGSGCSLDPRIAIQRSTTELTQTIDLFDETEKLQDENTHGLLDPCPWLRPLIKLDTLRNRTFEEFRLPPPTTRTVEEQIDIITQELVRTGHQPLKRCVSKLANGCAVFQVYVPGFERFNLIRLGLPVVPQRHLWTSRPVP